MMFRSPLHIAEPSLHDELAPPEPVIATPAVETVMETHEPALSATLENYSFGEAAPGHVQFAPQEEPPPEVTEYAAAPGAELGPSETVEDQFAEVPSELATPPVEELPVLAEDAYAAVEETPTFVEEASAGEPAAIVEQPPSVDQEKPIVEESASVEQPAAVKLQEPIVEVPAALEQTVIEMEQPQVTDEMAPPTWEEPISPALVYEDPALVVETPNEPPPQEAAPEVEGAAPWVTEEPSPETVSEPAPLPDEQPLLEDPQGATPEAAAPEPAPAKPAPAPYPPFVEQEVLHTIVRKVVAKMAPPVLSPAVVEELVETLVKEITTECAGSPTS